MVHDGHNEKKKRHWEVTGGYYQGRVGMAGWEGGGGKGHKNSVIT